MILAAASEGEESGGFHVPTISEFFPPAIFGEGTFYEFNRIMFVRLVMTAVLILLFSLATRKAKLVPGRAQNLAEMALEFVRVQIGEQILGHNAQAATPRCSASSSSACSP